MNPSRLLVILLVLLSFVRPDRERNYWTDDPDPALREASFPGARTVNRWRAQYLRDWQQRMTWLQTIPL